MAMKHRHDVVGLDKIPESREILGWPVELRTVGVDVECQDNRASRVTDMLGQVGSQELEACPRRVVKILAAKFALANKDPQADQVQRSPVPTVVQAVLRNVLHTGPSLVAGDDFVDHKSVALRAIVVAMQFVNRVRQTAIFSGQPVISEVTLPLKTLHGRVGAAVLVSAVDQIADNQHAQQFRSHIATPKLRWNRSLGEGTDDF